MRSLAKLALLAGVLSLSTAAMALQSGASGQSYYYVFDGNSLSLVQQDPTNVSAPKWAAFFFLKGRSTAISNRWGMSEKNTPADVLKSVESSQQFERSYEKWCGCDWGEETFFNVIAPVAMMDTGKVALDPLKVQLLNKTNEAWDNVQELMEQYNQAAELSGGETLRKVVTGPVAEYFKNVHNAIDEYKSTYEKIMQYSDAALQNLQNSVNAFAASVSHIQQTAPQALGALKVPASAGALGAWSGQASFSWTNPPGWADPCPTNMTTSFRMVHDGGAQQLVYQWNKVENCQEAALSDSNSGTNQFKLSDVKAVSVSPVADTSPQIYAVNLQGAYDSIKIHFVGGDGSVDDHQDYQAAFYFPSLGAAEAAQQQIKVLAHIAN
jgi:hypothetical protein